MKTPARTTRFNQSASGLLKIILVTLLLHAPASWAQLIPAGNINGSLELGPFIEYYEDQTESLSFEDITSPGFGVNFIPYDRDILHFGITQAAYWLRLNFDWSDLDEEVDRILEFGPPKIVGGRVRGGITIYALDASGSFLEQYTLGTFENQIEMRTLSRGFALRIDPVFGEQIYVRVSSARPLRLPVTLW